MSRSHPIPLAGPIEDDMLTGWRRVLSPLRVRRWSRAAKATYNRRVRRDAARQIDEENER